MADLKTSYLGLDLKNPLIASSSSLSDSVDGIKALEGYGVGAVVLKSLFEEEIVLEMDHEEKIHEKIKNASREHFDYFDLKIKQRNISEYQDLIRDTKKAVDIPVIASVNCLYSHEWTYFTKKIEEAGADAIELNMFFLPTDLTRDAQKQKFAYLNIVQTVLNKVNIPVSLKISPYFADLAQTIMQLGTTGIKGITLFNRFYSPDIDIEKEELYPGFVFSSKSDIALPLKWTGLMSEWVNCEFSASGGVHDAEAMIKLLLAGAQSVQIASTLFLNGPQTIENMLSDLKHWMTRHNYSNIDEFRGKLAQSKSNNPAVYERAQFIRHFSDREE